MLAPNQGRIGDTSVLLKPVNLLRRFSWLNQSALRFGGIVAAGLALVVSHSSEAHGVAGSHSSTYNHRQSDKTQPIAPKKVPPRKVIPSTVQPPAPAAPTAVNPPAGASNPSAPTTTPPKSSTTTPPSAPLPKKNPAQALADSPVKSAVSSTNLESEMSVLESLGVRFRPPAGAIVTKPVTGALAIYTVDDSRSPVRYHLQIQTIVSDLPEPTPHAQVAQYLAAMKTQDQKFAVILNEPWLNPKADGHILFTQTDLGEGIVAVQGWLILQIGPFEFITFSVLTSGADFPQIRPILEESFRTIQLDDLAQTSAERVERLRKGNELLKSITPEKLQALCGKEPRLYRVWRTDERGKEEEIGSYRVTVRSGIMSDASAENPPKTRENPTGILVLVQGRTVIDAASGRFADMDARFWSAWDHGSEAWTSRVTQRGGKLAERSIAQTGLRSARGVGNPNQVLTVVTGNAQSRTRDQKEWTVPLGIYWSQAETLLLGELLPRIEGQPPLNFAAYAFDPRSMSMPQRVENWTRTADGQWMLITQPGIDESAEITWHDAQGLRVRRSEPGGVVTELCLPRQLQQIWSEKGLQSR